MTSLLKKLTAVALILIVVATFSFGCGGGDEEGVTITIGESSDLSGPGAPAVLPIHYALENMVRYYNDEGFIPGVKFKLLTYNTKFDYARELPGYDWLRERGADIIVTVNPQSAEILKPFAEEDKMAIVSASFTPAMAEPPGWVFSVSGPMTSAMRSLLKWISESHWDWQTEGPAKVGSYIWTEPNSVAIVEAMEEYCQAHPDQFDYVSGVAVPLGTMNVSGGDIEKLKDCDYVCVSGMPVPDFIAKFRAKGYQGTIIDAGTNGSYVGFFVDKVGWEIMDGSLVALPSRNWNDSTNMVTETKEILHRYRSDKKQEIIYAGQSYVGCWQEYRALFQILEEAIAEVGAENFDSQAFYDVAVKYETSGPIWEGYPQMGFSQTKRYLVDYCSVYEFSAEAQAMVRLTDWLPMIEE